MGRHGAECAAEDMLFCVVWQAGPNAISQSLVGGRSDRQGKVEPQLELPWGAGCTAAPDCLSVECYHFF